MFWYWAIAIFSENYWAISFQLLGNCYLLRKLLGNKFSIIGQLSNGHPSGYATVLSEYTEFVSQISKANIHYLVDLDELKTIVIEIFYIFIRDGTNKSDVC